MNALIFMTFESTFGFEGMMSLNGSLAHGSQTQQDDIFALVKERKKGFAPGQEQNSSAEATTCKCEDGSLPHLPESTKGVKEDRRVNSEAVEETDGLSFSPD